MKKIKEKAPRKERKGAKRLSQVLLLFVILCITGKLFQYIFSLNIESFQTGYFRIDELESNILYYLFFPFVALTTLILAIVYRKIWGIIATAAVLAFHFLGNVEEPYATYISYALTIIILYLIVSHIRILSISFFILLWLYSVFFSIYTSIFFVLLIIVMRFVYYLAYENMHIIKDMGIKKLVISILKVIPTWSILILLFLPGYFLIKKAKQEIVKGLYAADIVRDYKDYNNTKNFRYNVDKTTKFKLKEIKFKLKYGISDLQASNKNNVKKIKALFDETVPKAEELVPRLHPKPKIYQVSKLIEDAVRKKIQNRIREERNELQQKYNHKIDLLAKDTDNLSEKVKSSIESNYNIVEGYRSTTIKHIFFFWDIYGYISALLFIYLLLYSFSYAFSRVAINEKNNLSATLYSDDIPNITGDVKCFGQNYTIGKQNKGVFYSTRKIEAFGCPPTIALPFWKTSVISRIIHKLYIMNKIDMSKNPSAVNFTVGGGKHFIEWKLKKGESVVINYRNLVIFSDSIRLKRIRTLKITSMLLGGIFFKVAQGPGKIVLLSRGKPLVNQNKPNGISTSLENLLAWNQNAKFDIEANNNVINMFFSTYNLRVKSKDAVIVDVNNKRKVKSGLARFIKSFAIPI